MNKSFFEYAQMADMIGSWVFYAVLISSIAVAVGEHSGYETISEIILIVASIMAVVCTAATTICQTNGNRALRLTQLSNSLGASVGDSASAGYYNNDLPKGILRLGATTLENTFYTSAVLSRMAWVSRFKAGIYALIMLVLFFVKGIPGSCLVVVAQTVFSADLLLKVIRLERYNYRCVRCLDQLEQFYLQKGTSERPNDLAILIAAFSDYECAKDEAALPLESKVFEELNPALAKKWSEFRSRLRLD